MTTRLVPRYEFGYYYIGSEVKKGDEANGCVTDSDAALLETCVEAAKEMRDASVILEQPNNDPAHSRSIDLQRYLFARLVFDATLKALTEGRG